MSEQREVDPEVERVKGELADLQAFASIAAEFRDPEAKQSIGLRFQKTAERLGDRTAVFFEDQEYSWRQLDTLANRFAHALAAVGVRRGDAVSILMENRIEFIAALLGVAKLGAVSAMLNIQLKPKALLHCYNLVNSKWCLFGGEMTQALDAVRSEMAEGTRCFFVADRDASVVPDWATDLGKIVGESSAKQIPVTKEIAQGEACFYLFTSGTTGMPKMAMVSHQRSLSLSAATGKLSMKSSELDRIYMTLPLYHGVGLGVGFCSTLITGASIILRRKFSARDFLKDVRDYKATTFVYIGELCRYVMSQPCLDDDADNPLRVIAGNGLRPDIWMEFKARFGIERVGEFYGASEGNVALLNVLNKDNTIGTPMGEMALVEYDVDNDAIQHDGNGRCIVVKEGEPGLMIGRIIQGNAFEGYTDKQATEKKIIRDAFELGDSWFNSGDLLKEVDVGFTDGLKHYQFVDRVGDTFRWKSENVATCEVGEVINGFAQVDLSNVYGVKIPGTEGRAGMAAIKLVDGFDSLDLEAFSAYVCSHLSHYARPVFLRVKSDIDITGSFKLVKGELRDQGYDPERVSDPLYVLAPGGERYETLTESMYQVIAGGQARY